MNINISANRKQLDRPELLNNTNVRTRAKFLGEATNAIMKLHFRTRANRMGGWPEKGGGRIWPMHRDQCYTIRLINKYLRETTARVIKHIAQVAKLALFLVLLRPRWPTAAPDLFTARSNTGSAVLTQQLHCLCDVAVLMCTTSALDIPAVHLYCTCRQWGARGR